CSTRSTDFGSRDSGPAKVKRLVGVVACEPRDLEGGPPGLLGHPLSRVPWSNTPPGAASPFIVEVALAFAANSRLGTRNVEGFVAAVPRPTRSHTYASPAALPRPSQGLR